MSLRLVPPKDWKCSIRPTQFVFTVKRQFSWGPPQTMPLHQCCCLEDGLRLLLGEGIGLEQIIAAKFATERETNHADFTETVWTEFSREQINEVGAIALEEARCS